jgi:hypothetical protein
VKGWSDKDLAWCLAKLKDKGLGRLWMAIVTADPPGDMVAANALHRKALSLLELGCVPYDQDPSA